MTAITCQPARAFNPLPLLLAVIVAAAVVYGSHAVAKHGTDAEQVRRCVENGWTLQLWHNPTTGRQAEVCALPSGKYGIQISRFGREITSFVKNKLTRLSQVERYLENSGYTRLCP